MNRIEHTDAPEQHDCLTRDVYEAPRLICLNETSPETGDFATLNENTGGMLES